MRLKAGTTRRGALHVCAGAAAVPLLGLVAATAAETDYPARPVRVIVPYPAGGGADTVSRILLAKLSDGLGQQFVIENRGGAGGTIGAAVAAKADRDGYTVLYDATAFSVNPSLYARLPYDALNDFQPVFLASLVPNLLVVHPSVEAKRPSGLQNGKDPLVFQGLDASGQFSIGYTIPNLLIDHAMRNPHVPPGFWRGVNINHNAIYLECFMDELAHAAGEDPLEFRRKLMAKHPKHLAVLNAVAEKAGWGKPAAQGVHRGLAQFMGFNSYTAAVAEISMKNNNLKVHRIVAATDCGTAVNPAQIERQIAGSFVYGLSALFYQECTVKNGRIEQENFDTYPSMRIAAMPHVESIVMPSGDFWGGVGEPTIAVAAPAVLNAIFAATGKRIRSFPLSKHGIVTS
jgi:Tripartite tricarboxylate transporter family receptor/Molybdopterin-binding domain of aldehyde dehydrogenase